MRQDMRHQKTKAQINKKLSDKTHPLSPHPHPDVNQPPPHPSHSPIIYNNNTMDTEFLVQMRQSNKCESVRKDEIFNLHLGSGAGPISFLLQNKAIQWVPTSPYSSRFIIYAPFFTFLGKLFLGKTPLNFGSFL